MAQFVINNDVDKNILLAAGADPNSIIDLRSGAQAPSGAVWVGAAGMTAPGGVVKLEGADRTVTAQLVQAYFANPNASSNTLDGKAIVTAILDQYGLSSLADQAWNQYTNSGNSTAYLQYWITTTPEFAARFPAYKQLAAEGRGVTIDEYNAYIKQMDDFAHQYDVPDGFMDATTIGNMLLAGKEPQEVQQDLQDYAVALAHPDVQARLAGAGLNVGSLTPGGLAAFFTDPKKAQPLLEQQFTAAQLGASSDQFGVSVTGDEANRLALQGVTAAQGQQAFGQVGALKPLLTPLPGSAEKPISTDTAAQAVVGGDPVAAAALKAQQGRRIAPFQAGGAFTTAAAGGGQGVAAGA